MAWGDHYFEGWWMLFGGIGMALLWCTAIWITVRGLSLNSAEPQRIISNDPEETARRRRDL